MNEARKAGELSNVTDDAGRLLRAAGDFVRAALPEAPEAIARALAGCVEVVVSVRVYPTVALCVTGIRPDGPVRWDITLTPRETDFH